MLPLLHRLKLTRLLALMLMSSASAAWAGTLVELSAEASRAAANDLIRATVFAEASGTSPKSLATQVNGLMAEAGRTAKSYGKVKSQSGSTSTYPSYGKGGRIEAWRMRSELQLESRDAESLSELLGRLQENLGVASLQFVPAPDTQKEVEHQAMLDALAAFQARARIVAQALGKPYKIKQLHINTAGQFRPPMMYRKAGPMLAEAAAPMPIEGGESQIQVTVSGQIELDD